MENPQKDSEPDLCVCVCVCGFPSHCRSAGHSNLTQRRQAGRAILPVSH